MAQTEIALAHAQLSARQLAEGAHGAALESIASALNLAPDLAPLWAQFSDLIRYFNLRHPVPLPVRELLSKALEHPAVDPGNLVRPVSTLALSQLDPLEEPLLLRLLEDAVIRDARLERSITDTRRRMLDEPNEFSRRNRYPSIAARRMPPTGRCIRCRAGPFRSPRSSAGRSWSREKNAASPRTFRL